MGAVFSAKQFLTFLALGGKFPAATRAVLLDHIPKSRLAGIRDMKVSLWIFHPAALAIILWHSMVVVIPRHIHPPRKYLPRQCSTDHRGRSRRNRMVHHRRNNLDYSFLFLLLPARSGLVGKTMSKYALTNSAASGGTIALP